MIKLLKIFLPVFFIPSLLHAQYTTKYALILGLNDYYIQPGVKHGASLRGCVNDANAMRGLLINRFGFSAANIQMLYNEQVTSKNVLGQMRLILEKCRPGDAFVFYYSGHGAWMSNPMNKADSIKRGMSQSMVMSDLYSPGLECLLTDEMLKAAFNEFVDKQVIVTSLFDCCYSGNLAMPFNSDFWAPFLKPETKGILLAGVKYIPGKIKPGGCAGTADTTDKDRDGVPDCRDWETDSPPFVKVDSLGVSDGDLSAEDIINLSSAFDVEHPGKDDRAFNMKDALKVWYPMKAKRPTDRPNSKFISLSAATDRQPAAEITDENELKRGAFTKSLLNIYRKNDANLPLPELLKMISQQIKDQGYNQIPTYHFDRGRLSGNLIGTSATGLSNTITATCSAAKDGSVALDKGLSAGISRGNIFESRGNKGTRITVTRVFDDSAVAIDKTGKIKPGDKFLLIDRHTVSNPIIKIFIPTIDCSPLGFESFFNTHVKKFVDSSNYSDYRFTEGGSTNRITLFHDDKKTSQLSLSSMSGFNENVVNRLIFLPLPSYIVDGLKKLLAKDQNFELVSDPAQADFVLYLNYMKKRAGYPAGYVFYFHPPIDHPDSKNIALFTAEHVLSPGLNLGSKNLQNLSQKLYELTQKTIRFKTTHWINRDPRRVNSE
jgi:hypothetical protein